MQDVVKIMRDIKSVPLKCISCAACAPQIEKVLSSIDTVEDISVNAITKIVSFTYDSEKVEMTDILVVLSKVGFDIGTNSDELYDEELYKLQKLLCFCGIICFTQTLPKLYFECSVFLITLILLGRYFETLAKGNAAQTIKKLLEIQSATDIIVQDGIEKNSY